MRSWSRGSWPTWGAAAGAVDPATVRRYGSALGHYLAFCARHDIRKCYPHAAPLDRDFRPKRRELLHGLRNRRAASLARRLLQNRDFHQARRSISGSGGR